MGFLNPYAVRLQEFSTFVLNEPELNRFYLESGGGWDAFFRERMSRQSAKLTLEIGCSNAAFLLSIAKNNPHQAFIGMDWKFKVIYKGAKKIEQDKLVNLALLRGRAQELSKIFGRAELDEIWVFFPDPWAKKGQLKHRLLQETFLLAAHRTLKPGGRIYFKTDHPGYFQWVLALFGEPEPELPEYSVADPEERSRRARQIKVRKLERENLPPQNEAVRGAFKLACYSTDYWGQSKRPPTAFSETQTLFEKLFVKDALPIYYCELIKK